MIERAIFWPSLTATALRRAIEEQHDMRSAFEKKLDEIVKQERKKMGEK